MCLSWPAERIVAKQEAAGCMRDWPGCLFFLPHDQGIAAIVGDRVFPRAGGSPEFLSCWNIWSPASDLGCLRLLI